MLENVRRRSWKKVRVETRIGDERCAERNEERVLRRSRERAREYRMYNRVQIEMHDVAARGGPIRDGDGREKTCRR